MLWQLGALARQHQLIIVHGAGSEITAAAATAGIATQRIDGLRVTPPEVLTIAQQVLRQTVQPAMKAQLAQADIHATVLQDGVTASLLDEAKYGRVGRVTTIDGDALQAQLNQTGALLIGPLLPDALGALLNVNADDVAMALANQLGVSALHFVTDVPGVLDGSGHLLAKLTPAQMQALTSTHVIQGGMTVKLRAGLSLAAHGTQVTIGSLYGRGTKLTMQQ